MDDSETYKKLPLLSLCIPTFNRPHTLGMLLDSIAIQPAAILKEVEICISDNSANDDAREVCSYFSEKLDIKYSKNIINIGGSANILYVPCLSHGTYCWILGDDDLLIDGSIEKLIKNLRLRPDMPGMIIGYSYENISIRESIIKASYAKAPACPNYIAPHDLVVLDDWTNSFLYTSIAACHTAIVGSVFKRENWIAYAGSLLYHLRTADLESLEATFPHSLIWANIFKGKEILFDPAPYTYFMLGDQEWFSAKWKTINYSFCLELAKKFRSSARNSANADHYDKLLLTAGISPLLVNKCSYVSRHFSLPWVIREFGHYDELWVSLRTFPSPEYRQLLKYYLCILKSFVFVPFNSKVLIFKYIFAYQAVGLAKTFIRKTGTLSRKFKIRGSR